jgi:lipoprotein-releasing system ATP-binding protein
MIECLGLCKTFATEAEDLTILSGLDLSVGRGESVAIMGPSGSGKSTLLSILGGLDRPSLGSVRVNGIELAGLPEQRLTEFRGASIGFVFQAHYLLKDFDALENVALPAYMAGMPRKAAFEKARALLADVGLESRLHHLPALLSGGERQRAALARALVNDPPLLLADEPTGNLDAGNASSVRDLIFALSRKYGSTVVLVTHDPHFADSADRSYELSGGRLARR